MEFLCLCKYDVRIVVLTVLEKPIICLGMNNLGFLRYMVVVNQSQIVIVKLVLKHIHDKYWCSRIAW